MGAVCILAPVVIAAWPAFSSAVIAAASSLGYQVVAEAVEVGVPEEQVENASPV
jgi:predicted negative regulator of RcsB-dependent stress response